MPAAKQKFDLFWSPIGGRIATVEAKNAKAAKRKAPKPYRKYLGEIYAQPTEHKFRGSLVMPDQQPTTSPYKALKEAGCKLDSHESDLYVKATPEADTILKAHGITPGAWGCERFTSQIDKQTWYDLPFMYDPWWEKRTAKR